MITIIDYGMGNLGSVVNMLKKVGAQSQVTSDIATIQAAQKLILPGVGSFDNAMRRLDETGLIPVLNECVLEKKVPILGICLGMQLLTNGSDEGKLKGLGWIDAYAHSFKEKFNELEDGKSYRIPHMGWNVVHENNPCMLTTDFYDESRFYFVHSYYVQCNNPEDSMLRTHYGIDFDSAIHRDNVYGMQFHPEKSHKFGLKVFDNFNKLV